MTVVRYLIVAFVAAPLFACSKSSEGVDKVAAPVAASVSLTSTINAALNAADGRLGELSRVDETLERQGSKLKGARVDRRLPLGAIDSAAMREVLTSYAKMHGLGEVSVKLGKVDRAKTLPKQVTGEEPVPLETAQIIASAPIAISVNVTDETRLKAYFKAMVTLQLPLTVLPTLLIEGGKATFSGAVYFRRALPAPKRTLMTPALEEMAKKEGLTLPQEASELKALRSLHAQLVSKRALIAGLMEKQDTIARQGRVLQFLRNKAKEIASQSVPKIIKAPALAPPGSSGSGTAP